MKPKMTARASMGTLLFDGGNKGARPAVQASRRAYGSSVTDDWRRHIEPFTRPLFFAFSRLTRGMTLGVRALALDESGRVLLVRHTYLAGWWLPGGGVDRGETTRDAVIRELREEAGLIARSEPRLLSIHSNERFFRGDHVLVYRIDAFDPGERSSHNEIAEIGWFAPDALAAEVNAASARRIHEALTGAPPDPLW